MRWWRRDGLEHRKRSGARRPCVDPTIVCQGHGKLMIIRVDDYKLILYPRLLKLEGTNNTGHHFHAGPARGRNSSFCSSFRGSELQYELPSSRWATRSRKIIFISTRNSSLICQDIDMSVGWSWRAKRERRTYISRGK